MGLKHQEESGELFLFLTAHTPTHLWSRFGLWSRFSGVVITVRFGYG